MKPRIVVVGSSNTDMILRLPRVPVPGETLLGGHFAMAAGGKGANQAVAAARSGGRTTLIARVGRDVFGDRALEGFREDGICVDHIRRDVGRPSGIALIFVANDGQNSIGVAAGANARLLPSDVRRAERVISQASVLLLQLETPLPTVQAAVELAQRRRVPVILNPAPSQKLPSKLLRQVSILTPNETEAEGLTGVRVRSEAGARRAADHLLGQGVEAVVITLGSKGAWLATRSGHQRVPGYKVVPVDTTAAGDVFNGALAVALGEGRPLLEAVRFGNAAAAISVTRKGAQPSAPNRVEIDRWMRRHSRSGVRPFR